MNWKQLLSAKRTRGSSGKPHYVKNTDFERILNQIAVISSCPAAELREIMQQAMDAALADPSPVVQAMWDSIPRRGSQITLDEFMAHLIRQNILLP